MLHLLSTLYMPPALTSEHLPVPPGSTQSFTLITSHHKQQLWFDEPQRQDTLQGFQFKL